MKRRKAIQNIITVSAGISLLPSCQLSNKGPVFSNLPLGEDQRLLIKNLADEILPLHDLEIDTPESTLNFILTMVNDCYSPEEIDKYVTGLDQFQLFLDENYSGRFKRIESMKLNEILQHLESSDVLSEDLRFFYSNTKNLTIQHFTSSDYFMTNYLDYEMIPGRYNGCVTV